MIDIADASISRFRIERMVASSILVSQIDSELSAAVRDGKLSRPLQSKQLELRKKVVFATVSDAAYGHSALSDPGHGKIDIGDQLAAAKAHVLKRNRVHEKIDVVLAQADLLDGIAADEFGELALLFGRPAGAESHCHDDPSFRPLEIGEGRVDEEFVFAVLANYDEAIVHGRAERFVESKVERVGKRALFLACELLCGDMRVERRHL